MRTIALPPLPTDYMHSVVILFRALRTEKKTLFVISLSYSIDLSITALSFINFTIDFLNKIQFLQAYSYKADINAITFNELLIRCT